MWTDPGGFTNIRFHKWLEETRRRTWNSGVWQCNEELQHANVVLKIIQEDPLVFMDR
jgi:hypothetical protein